jgi:hypothetical protein
VPASLAAVVHRVVCPERSSCVRGPEFGHRRHTCNGSKQVAAAFAANALPTSRPRRSLQWPQWPRCPPRLRLPPGCLTLRSPVGTQITGTRRRPRGTGRTGLEAIGQNPASLSHSDKACDCPLLGRHETIADDAVTFRSSAQAEPCAPINGSISGTGSNGSRVCQNVRRDRAGNSTRQNVPIRGDASSISSKQASALIRRT